MVKRDLIRNIIIAVLAIVVILLLRAFVFSTHRVTEGQANDYIHAGDYVTFNKNVAVGTYVVTFESAKYQDVKVSVKVNKAKGTLTTKAKTTVNTAIGSKSFNLGAKATTGMKVSYASSNKKVATVSSNGTVSIKGTGIATITVAAS